MRRIAFWAILIALLFNIMITVPTGSSIAESRIDAFTWKGGQGDNVPSPPFAIEEEVILYTNVTYGGWPEPNKDVIFQIIDPLGRIYFLAERTDESGLATVTFAFPIFENYTENFGSWIVFASASIAGEPTVDKLVFDVRWILGDINNNLEVDLYDVILICVAYGANTSDPEWNLLCDVAEPYGIINIIDVVTVTANYEETWE